MVRAHGFRTQPPNQPACMPLFDRFRCFSRATAVALIAAALMAGQPARSQEPVAPSLAPASALNLDAAEPIAAPDADAPAIVPESPICDPMAGDPVTSANGGLWDAEAWRQRMTPVFLPTPIEQQPWAGTFAAWGPQSPSGAPRAYPPGFTMSALARGYYLDDQRIKWSGLEQSFGAEAALNPRYVHQANGWTVVGNGVFFLNQPYDSSTFNSPALAPYTAGLAVSPFQIWQLNLSATRGDLKLTIGKDNSPFGRYYFPLYSNARLDAPFIRTEAIQWVETGAFLKWTPGPWSLDLAVTNGGQDRDTNSSKAVIGRFGLQGGWGAVGISGKFQDGLGTDYQKLYDNYYGVDGIVRFGPFDLSGEAIYDQYGLHAKFDPTLLAGGIDLYGRDNYSGRPGVPLSGFGYYVNLGWTERRFRLDLNYGEFYPRAIGIPEQDAPTRRGVVKGAWNFSNHFLLYGMLLFEGERPVAPVLAQQHGFAMLSGAQLAF